jgi:hypothetical protein
MASTPLTADQAADLFEYLPGSVRSAASLAALQGQKGLGLFVRAACEEAGELGLQVTADGQLLRDQPGADAEESARHAAALSDPAQAKALEKAVGAAISRSQRQRAVARALYAAGFELQVAVAERTEPA